MTEKAFSDLDDCIIATVGPTGEGKSTALKQAALDIALNNPDTVALFSNLGNSGISRELVEALRLANDLTVLVVDEADLVLPQLEILTAEDPGRIVLLAALHDHYTQALLNRARAEGLPVTIIEGEAAHPTNHLDIAEFWHANHLIPETYIEQGTEETASLLEDAGHSSHGPSLFGALLWLWDAPGLQDRIYDLLRRLAGAHIKGQNLRTILGAVAAVQVAWDPQDQLGKGLSEPVLAELCGIHSSDVLSLITTPLGRELGLSRMSGRVYVRHPKLAQSIWKTLQDLNLSAEIVKAIGSAGAKLRTQEDPTSRSAYLLTQRLTPPDAVAAAEGAIHGAPRLLEPRVSYLTAPSKRADTHLLSSTETHCAKTCRSTMITAGFCVASMWSEPCSNNTLGHLSNALGYSAGSLSDLECDDISVSQLRYGLVNIYNIARHLAGSGNSHAREVAHNSWRLAATIPGADAFLGAAPSTDAPMSVTQAVRILGQHSQPFAQSLHFRGN